jgi:hypothetical protein
MARFDKSVFLQTTYDEVLDTERTLFPVGECVCSGIEELDILEPQSFTDKETGEQKEGSPRVKIKARVREDHAERIRAEFGYDPDRPVYFNYAFYLDINSEGHLEFGPNKNIPLGQLRAAVGQNVPGEPWSIVNLRGAGAFGFVLRHEEWEKGDKKGKNERVSKFFMVEDE